LVDLRVRISQVNVSLRMKAPTVWSTPLMVRAVMPVSRYRGRRRWRPGGERGREERQGEEEANGVSHDVRNL